VDWIYLAQDSQMWPVLVKAEVNIGVLLNVGNFYNTGMIINYSTRSLLHSVMLVLRECKILNSLRSLSPDFWL
jgi:hypothetical protein